MIGHGAFPVRAARYQDRAEAAQILLDALPPLTNQNTVVIALPRGGVPVAAPVASSEVLAELRKDVDLIVCPEPHLPLGAVGVAYQSFPQTSDDEVIALLRAARDAAPREPN